MADSLTHYGVPGMKWGHRKANPVRTSKQDAKTDFKAKRKLYKTTYPGIRKDRAALQAKINDRMRKDPVYAAKFKKLPWEKTRAVYTVATVGLGAYAVGSYIKTLGDIGVINTRPFVNRVNKGSDFLANKIRTAKATRPRNPKSSPYWNDMVVKGSGQWVGTAMELYRGL